MSWHSSVEESGGFSLTSCSQAALARRSLREMFGGASPIELEDGAVVDGDGGWALNELNLSHRAS